MVIYKNSPRVVTDNPLCLKLLSKNNSFVTLVICCKICPFKKFLPVLAPLEGGGGSGGGVRVDVNEELKFLCKFGSGGG